MYMSENKAFDVRNASDILQYLKKNHTGETIVELVHREGYLNNVHYDIQTGEEMDDVTDSHPLRVRFL